MIRTVIKIIKWVGIVGTAVVAWYTFVDLALLPRLSPFRPTAQIGRPIFGLLQKTSYPTIAVSVSIGNRGRQRGCILDLALLLRAKGTKTEWSFFPVHYLKGQMYDYARPKEPEPAIESDPHPLNLGSKETVTKAALFLNRPPKNFPRLTIAELKSNEVYELRLYAFTSSNGCIVSPGSRYTNIASDELRFSELLTEIKSGTLVQVVPIKLDDLRENFVAGKLREE